MNLHPSVKEYIRFSVFPLQKAERYIMCLVLNVVKAKPGFDMLKWSILGCFCTWNSTFSGDDISVRQIWACSWLWKYCLISAGIYEHLPYQPHPRCFHTSSILSLWGQIWVSISVSSLTYCVTLHRLHHFSEPVSTSAKWKPIIHDRIVVRTQWRKYIE